MDDLSVDINTHNLSKCEYEGCTNFSALNYEEVGFVQSDFGFLMPATIDDGSCIILGCTLENYPNYNDQATIEDGSCDSNHQIFMVVLMKIILNLQFRNLLLI